jgi:hypothetical protein
MHLGVSAVDLSMKNGSSISHIHISLTAYISVALNMQMSGFGGLGVACCLSVPKFAGSNPAEATKIFQGEKILSTPFFGG